MGIVQNVIGLVRDINDRKRAAQVDAELKNYLTNPDATVAAISQIDPRFGIQLDDATTAREAAATEAANKRQDRALGTMREYLRGLPEGADTDAAFQQMAPFMAQLGVPEQLYGGFQQAVKANPNALLDEKAYENMMEDRFSGTVVTPGSIYMRGGKEVTRAPYAMKAETTPAGATTNVFDPNKGQFVGAGGGGGAPEAAPTPYSGGPLTVDQLRPLFVAQESSGDYTARNPETGAMGRYQIMPDTGRALAKKVGVAWRPAMMTKDDEASRRYQDALGNAAIQESIDFGAGDPARTFSHYYGGPDTRKWGRRTRQYTSEMMDRLGGGAGNGAVVPGSRQPTVTSTSVVNPPKPAKDEKTYRAATAAELEAAGYPKGSAAQIGSDGKMVNLKTPPAKNIPPPYDQEKARTLVDSMKIFGDGAMDLLNDPGLDSAVGSFQGRMPSWMIGSTGETWRNKLDSLKSNIGLQQLQSFKAQSSQGASGFGNLSNAEGAKLEQAYGTLATTSNEATIRKNLQTIVDTTRRARERIMWQMERAAAGADHNVPPEGTVKNGFRFLGGSPANRANWQKVGK